MSFWNIMNDLAWVTAAVLFVIMANDFIKVEKEAKK